MRFNLGLPGVGSGFVVTTGVLIAALLLYGSGSILGWDATWRSFNVTPLQPDFFDVHVPLDYANCALQGIDPYVPQACNVASLNIPPVWLWLGWLRLDGSASEWLAACIIACAFAVIVMLFAGRSMSEGIVGLIAILSPSVLMGIERGNPDLLILALVGLAALFYRDHDRVKSFAAILLITLGVVLKLFPVFSIALAARFNRRTFLFSLTIAVLAVIYVEAIFKYIVLIRANVPTTFILSYGYKTAFLGWDHLRSEAGLEPAALANTWLPIGLAIIVSATAAMASYRVLRLGRTLLMVPETVAGNAFLFGSGIYCGTFLLGTNFIYRLMFLLLCIPQLQDWMSQKSDHLQRQVGASHWLFAVLLAVLWLNGNANGHSTFLWAPQVCNWLLFFELMVLLIANFLRHTIGTGRGAG